MGLGDMAKKAKDALSSDKGEQTSDRVLDGAANLANKVTGGKHADKIQRGRDAADERIGTDDRTGTTATGPTSTTTHGTGGTDGVNAVGNAGGSGHGTGTTAAGAEQPGPDEPTGRHRA
ncbi:antitoxin [Georgenia phoenicis]|uniref:antitoxin n=1 Tax=unclassified Georgenia TaxID=2626815 RepID=UPI0039B0DC60